MSRQSEHNGTLHRSHIKEGRPVTLLRGTWQRPPGPHPPLLKGACLLGFPARGTFCSDYQQQYNLLLSIQSTMEKTPGSKPKLIVIAHTSQTRACSHFSKNPVRTCLRFLLLSLRYLLGTCDIHTRPIAVLEPSTIPCGWPLYIQTLHIFEGMFLNTI